MGLLQHQGSWGKYNQPLSWHAEWHRRRGSGVFMTASLRWLLRSFAAECRPRPIIFRDQNATARPYQPAFSVELGGPAFPPSLFGYTTAVGIGLLGLNHAPLFFHCRSRLHLGGHAICIRS
jgi:hypothetical protein